ncbi:MAG: hypothetical protein Q8L74_16645 [Nitrospirota bacterium]|nr:hypothetical protein [Nitrospirota bacterium]MDP2384553.1 hypothetical protein [Nitrospirota bacterium]MDP3597610.1 hypothetical protein [Nitrospirota bacterium]
MTCHIRAISFLGSAGLVFALLASQTPDTFAAEADRAMPSGDTGAYQSLPPDKKRSLGQGMATDDAGEVGSRGMPQFQRPTQLGAPAQPGTPDRSTTQSPTWPQKFDVQGPEADSFGFAVTQPGPVVVEVQSQGAPVIVTLQGPAPQPISQQGAGQVLLTYTVTAQDVQTGVLWNVQIRLAQPTAPQQGGRAGGIVTVQHPPVNQAVVQQAVQAMTAQQKHPTQQDQQQAAAQAEAQMERAFQQRKSKFDRQLMDRRTALHAQIQPQLDQLRSRMSGQIRPRGIEETEGSSGIPGVSAEGEIGTRALRGDQMIGIMKQPLDTTTGQKLGAIVPPSTASSAQPIQGVGSTSGPQSVMPNPVIASLSVTQGQPGDPLLINGSGFGTGGEVHFVIGPGKDLVAPAGVIWNDTQIFTTVPEATGVLGFNGTVYLKRTTGNVNSNLVPFRFNPTLEIREIRATMDRVLKWPVDEASPANKIKRASANFIAGFKDNDVFFGNTRLKNGWVSDEAFVYCEYQLYGFNFCTGGAYVWEIKKGTDWPYLNVRWWMNPAPFANYSHVYYTFAVRIVGPKGVADGVVVP